MVKELVIESSQGFYLHFPGPLQALLSVLAAMEPHGLTPSSNLKVFERLCIIKFWLCVFLLFSNCMCHLLTPFLCFCHLVFV